MMSFMRPINMKRWFKLFLIQYFVEVAMDEIGNL